MLRSIPHAALPMLCLTTGLLAGSAQAAIEPSYTAGDPPVTSTWYAARSAPAQLADRDYLAGMRPHHVGALTMSRDFLADPARRSPLLQALARAIIANQTFEIDMLDAVQRTLDGPALRLPFGILLQPVAVEGLGDAARFFRTPVPSAVSDRIGPVSARDVEYAKAMIVHHAAALTMARDYHANPSARNGYLGLMNVDIIADQSQEIALMERVIAAYPGDASAILVQPGMVHGMDGMAHAGDAHAGHAVATPSPVGAGVALPAESVPARREAPAQRASRPRTATAPSHAHHGH